MNVLVLSSMVPFVWGGAEELAMNLVRNLRLHGANAEAMRIPFCWDPPERLIDQLVLCQSLKLRNVDRVIGLKFPAYHVPHHDKVMWLLHQHRQAYDLWDAGLSNIPATDRGQEIRRVIKNADNTTFISASHMFCISSVVARRLRLYNGLSAQILIPPLNDPELFTNRECGDYILAMGRVNSSKRQWLLIEAMRHAPACAKLVIAGPPDSKADLCDLQTRVSEAGVADKVKLDLRFLPRTELAELVRRAVAVAYVPYDEDALSYVVMEAFEAGKPVITTSDSGGLLEIVVPDETGYVAEPNPRALGEAISQMISAPAIAPRLGRAAHAKWRSLEVNWPATIERLLS